MILCCGESLIDMLPRETAAGEPGFSPFPGGAVFNTAIALARLDAPTGFFSGVSTDLFGEMLVAKLTGAGVDTRPLARSARPTTLAFVTLSEGHASYAFYDENTAGRMLTRADLPPTDAARALFFGGISLAVEPCAGTYMALAEREAGKRTIMCDPNVRSSFIADPQTYRSRIDRMLAMSDIVKLSDEDLAWLSGSGGAGAARAILARGPRLVCITEGARGVTGYMADRELFVPAQPVEVVDTVGAGDTFNAGLLASLDADGALGHESIGALDEATLRRALTLGVRAAAVTVSRAGANPPTRAELG